MGDELSNILTPKEISLTNQQEDKDNLKRLDWCRYKEGH